MNALILQAVVVLLIAVAAVPLARALGLGSVLGYLIGGIIAGPVLRALGANVDDLLHFAEYGVVMLLFVIGLELAPSKLWQMRTQLLGYGGLQLGLSVAAVTGAGLALGLAPTVALAAGLVLAPSSTAIVLQTLTERRLLKTQGGEASFAVLLAQDVAIIPFLALLPLLGQAGAHADSHSLVEDLPGWAGTALTVGAVALVVLAGQFLTRPIFGWIARARMRETYTAAALLLVVGISALMGAVGLSAALGTFLAGVVLANSEFRHELEANVEPFKGLLMGLFFIAVGAGIDLGLLVAQPLTALGLTAALIGGKAAILWGIARAFRLGRAARALFAFSLAGAGEFGFVLLAAGSQLGVFGEERAMLSLVVALSMLATPLLFLGLELLHRRQSAEAPEHDMPEAIGPVIIAGQGRFGQVVNRLLLGLGHKTVVLDSRFEVIDTLRRVGLQAYFGDPTRPELLHAAGLATAKVLVVTVDDPADAIRLTAMARAERPDLFIVARAYDRYTVYRLYQAGADKIVRETFDSAVRAGRNALEGLGVSRDVAFRASQAFIAKDRENLRILAEFWDPSKSLAENEAYVEMSRKLNSDIGIAMEGLLEDESD